MKIKTVIGAFIAGIVGLPLLGALVLVGVAMLASGDAAVACSGGSARTSSSSETGTAPPNTQLLEAIHINTKGKPRLALAMLMGTGLESRYDPKAVGSGSYGPWQIQDPGVIPGPHPDITIDQALDPAYSTNYIRPNYVRGVSSVSESLWVSNPMIAGHNAAYRAERPAKQYIDSQGPERVRWAYNTSVGIMQKWGMSIGLTKASSNTTIATPATPATGASDVCNLYADLGYTDLTIQKVLGAAQKYLGTPYVDGGGTKAGPSVPSGFGSVFKTPGFDEAGFITYAFNQGGISLERTLSAQLRATRSTLVKPGTEKPGDVVFFSDRKDRTPSAAGIIVDPSTHTMILAVLNDEVRYANYTEFSSIVAIVRPIESAPVGPVGTKMVGRDGFGSGQCVIYVKYIVVRHVKNFPPGGSIGFAGKDIARTMGQRFGYKVDNRPAIHSVVSFPASPTNGFGHVAIVSGINPDGSILVEESNWANNEQYGFHTVPRSIVGKLTYAHVEGSWSDAPLR